MTEDDFFFLNIEGVCDAGLMAIGEGIEEAGITLVVKKVVKKWTEIDQRGTPPTSK